MVRKLGTIKKKRIDMVKPVIDNVRYCQHGLCTFPNIVIKANIAIKSGKIRINMIWTVVSHFSHPFLGTCKVHQFLDLGYLEGTPFQGGI